ncbi:MAG TPA: transcription termination/antitermination protein NusA [Firmicutes bacterium]|nr:transcription termination/antitermination protein NusA [Candidatus Fermentithermobacillaceae bacterium]
MNGEIMSALDQLERERGISKDDLIEAMEAALLSAYRKHFGTAENVRVQFDRETGNIKVLSRREVVSQVKDPHKDILVSEAKRKSARYQEGDYVEEEVHSQGFGRIAAQTAKQVVMQKLRDIERGMIYEEFSEREGDVVTGQIIRVDRGVVIVDLGRAEGFILPQEQARGERYRERDRIKSYVLEVKKTSKGPQILLSRTHPGLLKRLFELEVPEIRDGVVEIKGLAREAGSRSKVAVTANLPEVDALGACVGPRGSRVQVIVQELRGERIDIIQWDDDPQAFVGNALSPARVIGVELNRADRVARVVVPDNQLSLAIGRDGQNARLAAKLTGWKIDIRSERNM